MFQIFFFLSLSLSSTFSPFAKKISPQWSEEQEKESKKIKGRGGDKGGEKEREEE